jgi:hypothetical protein
MPSNLAKYDEEKLCMGDNSLTNFHISSKTSYYLDWSLSVHIRDWEGHAPCAIGASKSIVAHWGSLSMRPCVPCKFWLIILLFLVSIKVVFYFVMILSLSLLIVNFPLMAIPWFSLSIFVHFGLEIAYHTRWYFLVICYTMRMVSVYDFYL